MRRTAGHVTLADHKSVLRTPTGSKAFSNAFRFALVGKMLTSGSFICNASFIVSKLPRKLAPGLRGGDGARLVLSFRNGTMMGSQGVRLTMVFGGKVLRDNRLCSYGLPLALRYHPSCNVGCMSYRSVGVSSTRN